VATSTATGLPPSTPARVTAVPVAYALGALLLLGEAAVHIQQFVSLFYVVRWIGPLFLANAVTSVAAIAGLAHPRTRQLAALAGIVISAVALGSLVVSYGQGLFRLAGGRLPHSRGPRRDHRSRRPYHAFHRARAQASADHGR
jgi:hypothetical protein